MGILQGIIFGFIVLLNKKYASKTNSYLAYTSFCLSLSNLQYWFFDSKLTDKFVFLDWVRLPLEFLMIPMFYLFVNYYLNKKISNRKKILLITPFVIDSLCHLFISLNSSFFKIESIENLSSYFYVIEEFFSLLFSSFLIISTLRLVKQSEIDNLKFDIEKVVAKTKWLKQILFLGLIACLFWIVEIYFIKNIITDKDSEIDTSVYYPLWITISIIIYWLSYVGLFQSNIYTERKEIRKELLATTEEIRVMNRKTDIRLSGQYQEKLFEEFKKFVQKSYINPDLNLNEVAASLEISSNYLSQIINSKNIRFNDYVNSIRIEQVKTMLKSDVFSEYTITSIGLEAGFNSNASFYRAFKKNTGVSPSEYRKIS